MQLIVSTDPENHNETREESAIFSFDDMELVQINVFIWDTNAGIFKIQCGAITTTPPNCYHVGFSAAASNPKEHKCITIGCPRTPHKQQFRSILRAVVACDDITLPTPKQSTTPVSDIISLIFKAFFETAALLYLLCTTSSHGAPRGHPNKANPPTELVVCHPPPQPVYARI